MAHAVSACREAKYRWRPSTLICTRRSRSSSGNAHADAAASANVACIRHNEMLFTRNKVFASNCPAAKHKAAHKSIVCRCHQLVHTSASSVHLSTLSALLSGLRSAFIFLCPAEPRQ